MCIRDRKKGMPFRDAYKIVGKLVALCLELGTDLERLPLEKYREVSDVFAEDVYRAISLETCVSERKVLDVYKRQGQPRRTAAQSGGDGQKGGDEK